MVRLSGIKQDWWRKATSKGDDGIFICQKRYCAELLKRFQMFDCNPARIPLEVGTKLSREGDVAQIAPIYFKQIIRSLRYLTCTRPDIAYGVGLINRYLEAPRQSHLQVVKRIMRYLNETYDHGLFNSSSNNCDVVGYFDSDWSGDHDDRKSTSSYIFNFGSDIVSWSLKKQSIVAHSTCEAEYVAAVLSACQVI
ncbi:uncharacterized protein LOC109837891 [Asparagus officinalis]|uniref:uncharacterized protein LOC109837891 n=1 Tax=Asparagus officinalis TaxID=4686 RepID=UPI00098E166D|nr:uncharacterized protein LOC109837891 [Asparagus officinalis]